MPSRLFLTFLLAFIVLRLVFWLHTFPNPDEAYYWLWGQHPGWSYYDHPPLAAWIEGAFTAVFGRSNLVLRSPNLFSNGILFFTYYRITRYLYGEQARYHFWLLVLLVLASPLYFLFLALAWHDHWLITFSLISAYLFIRFLDGYLKDGKGESWRLYGAAGAIALAGLCKYNAVFVGLGFVATVLADKRLRPLIRDLRVYWAGAIASSALIPILLWNVSNNFQSFHYYFNRSVNSGSFSLKISPFINFILFSFLTVSPINWLSFIHGLRQQNRFKKSLDSKVQSGEMQMDSGNQEVKGLQSTSQETLYSAVAFWVFIISTVILTIISLISAALYYWNITAYLLLFPLATSFFLQPTPESPTPSHPTPHAPHPAPRTPPPTPRTPHPAPRTPHSTLLLSGQLYGLLFAALLVIHYSFLPLSALASKTEDPDSRMLFGWDDVAAIVNQQTTDLAHPFLVTTDYRTASALAYQLNDKNVLAISERLDQFDFWYTSDQPFKGRDALILSDDWHPVQPELLAQFEQTSVAIPIPATQFGVWIKNYYATKGYRFKGGKVS